MEFSAQYTINWQEYFRMMKRWYYRLRGEKDLLGLKVSDREDFFIAFFMICEHFKDRLIEEGIATKNEITELIAQYDELTLCREIANGFKHVKLNDTKKHKDVDTKVTVQKIQIAPLGGSSYLESFLKINSPARGIETYNTFGLVERCMNIWGKFLISKNLEIPCIFQEAHKFFNKWEPKI